MHTSTNGAGACKAFSWGKTGREMPDCCGAVKGNGAVVAAAAAAAAAAGFTS
jgi:hypothetical protein